MKAAHDKVAGLDSESLLKELRKGFDQVKFCQDMVFPLSNITDSAFRRLAGYNAFAPKDEQEAAKELAKKIRAEATDESELGYSYAHAFEVSVKPYVTLYQEGRALMSAALRELGYLNDFIDETKGSNDFGVAQIVALLRDPGRYANHSKVWKMLGYAPYKGRAMSSWRKYAGKDKLTADEWVDNPFAPDKYAITYAIGEALFKAQASKKNDTIGHYAQIYYDRKATTTLERPDWSKQQCHRDALRKMTKRYIRDIHRTWMRNVQAAALQEAA